MHTLSEREAPANARPYLVDAVRRRSFVLFLGAGVSRGLGLPNWQELVQKCCVLAGIDFHADKKLPALMDRAFDAEASAGRSPSQLVRRALYETLPSSGAQLPVDRLQNPLLLSLGALVMSAARRSNAEVVTWNFDNILESYLVAHGFSVQVLTSDAFDLRGDVDVHVYHPHGYLPYGATNDSDDLVLSRDQFLDRMSENTDRPWSSLVISRLHVKTMIAVGLSFEDENLLRLMRHVTPKDRPLGYSIGVFDDDERAMLRKERIVPVCMNDHQETPAYLLNICQLAARSVNVTPS